MDCIITIELGTNAVRVFAFDLNGNVIGSAKGSYPTFHSAPDYSEQDPEQIFITMLYVLKNFLSEKIHPKKYHVICICFSASMHSVLAIDKNGAPRNVPTLTPDTEMAIRRFAAAKQRRKDRLLAVGRRQP